MKKFIHSFIDFIYPPVCLVCQKKLLSHQRFCDFCSTHLSNSLEPHVYKNQEDFSNLQSRLFLDQVISCWSYSEALEKVLEQIKYKNGRRLCRFMGRWMGEILMDHFNNDPGILMPVPLHTVRKRERGYNQSQLLCHELSILWQWPMETRQLKRKKYTTTQTKLSAEERQENVHGAFKLSKSEDLKNRPVYLVDDVITTGATMNACARVLKEAGVHSVIGLSLARPV